MIEEAIAKLKILKSSAPFPWRDDSDEQFLIAPSWTLGVWGHIWIKKFPGGVVMHDSYQSATYILAQSRPAMQVIYFRLRRAWKKQKTEFAIVPVEWKIYLSIVPPGSHLEEKVKEYFYQYQ